VASYQQITHAIITRHHITRHHITLHHITRHRITRHRITCHQIIHAKYRAQRSDFRWNGCQIIFENASKNKMTINIVMTCDVWRVTCGGVLVLMEWCVQHGVMCVWRVCMCGVIWFAMCDACDVMCCDMHVMWCVMHVMRDACDVWCMWSVTHVYVQWL
jgi:hypothetical protein